MKYSHIDFAPSPAAREAARRALSEETTPAVPNVTRATVGAVAAGRRLTPPILRRLASGAEDDAVTTWARKVTAAMDAADKAASSGAAPHTSVCVVLTLPRDVAEYVSLDGEGADMHVTLTMLGSIADVSPEAVAMVRASVDRWAAEMPSFPARFSGVGRFSGEGADAAVLLVDSPGLSAARDDLCRRIRALGLALPAEHGFTPHATLCYLAKGAEMPPLAYDLPLAFTFDAASVWAGDDRSQVVPLTGNGDPTTMRDIVHGEGITLLFDATPPAVGHRTWNQIARYGTWSGHPQGPFTFNAKTVGEIIRNFRAQKNPVTVDFEHMSEVLPDGVAATGAPSLAWIVDLDDRGESGGFWACFEWVDATAVEYVRAKKYRYLSPAVRFAAVDRVTGKHIGARLTSVALTNQPFLDGLAPLTASDNTPPRASAPHKEPTMPEPITPPVAPVDDAAVKARDAAVAELASATVRLSDMDAASAKTSADLKSMTERFDSMKAKVMSLAGVNAEEDENAALAKLQKIVDDMNAAQVAEAGMMADRAILGHGLSVKMRDALIAHARRDAVDFAECYPKAKDATVKASDAERAEAARAGATITPEVKTLLSQQVTPSNAPPAPIIPHAGTVAEQSKAREEMAAQLLRDKKAPDYFTAVSMADDALTARRRASAVAPFAGNPAS